MSATLGRLTAILFLALASPAGAVTGSMPKLPAVGPLGVIPVQWDGEEPGFETTRDMITPLFSKSVRAARRFRVLSDDLVAGLWQEETGREELRNQFELNAFASLAVAPRGDVVTLTARLLDAQFKTRLIESDTVPRRWLSTADSTQLSERLENLVFRLFNRIPVDVSVTSVQGLFITLSGGAEQGIQTGDTVEVVRTSIKSLHPANGSWLEFDKRPLGSAQVIDVKQYASVARITTLTCDDAIEVGDGARIAAISGRAKFARLAINDTFRDAGDEQTIIVPPIYTAPAASGKTLSPAPVATSPDARHNPDRAAADASSGPSTTGALAEAQVQTPQPESTHGDPAKTDQSAAEAAAQPAEEDTGPSLWDQMDLKQFAEKPFDDVTVYGGPFWWSATSKEFNSAGSFPIWLLNNVGLQATRTLFHKIKFGFGGGVMFGKTAQGSYLGYDSNAKIYWEGDLAVNESMLKTWRAGGIATFSGMSVSGERYGGGDWLRGGGFAGLGGILRLGDGSQRYDWFADYTLLPLNIGRVGYGASRKIVESSLGWKVSVGAFLVQPASRVQFGGAVDVGDERETLKNGRRPHFNDYAIKALARYAL